MPAIVSDIIALPGWNAPMLLLLAKATLILIAALGITIAMQRGSAGARHLVWLGTLATLLFVPAVTAWAPPLRLAILPPVVEQQKIQPTVPAPAAAKKTAVAPSTQAATTSRAPVSSAPTEAGMLSRLSGLSLAISIWGFIALAIGLWLAYGAMIVHRIVKRARPLDTHDWLTPFYEVADRLELENPPRLLSSSDAKMPFACGFFKPTIVLPADCESWSVDRRRAVLLHELAHVKRHDLVGHTLGRLACALYWFHPLVWTAAKQLRNESERACDDLALSCGARASDYAEHLLDIVTSVRRDSTPAVALAMARRKEFEGRMLAILDPELRHSMPSRRQSFALISSLALMAIVVGAAAPAPRAAAAKIRLVNSVPAQDSDFSPKDVPLSEDLGTIGKHTSRSIDKSLDKSLDKTIDRTLDQTIGKSVDRSVDKSVDKSLERVFGKSFASTITDAVLGGKTQGKSDERATLLANILKTDADPSLRRTAAWGLSEYGEMNVATDALAQALRKDADPSVREMAA
ncbi:MAG TPA: M56 family metallopeptidase, partial [Gemmatimonadaceae bacterium]|nr:M56 family metallopeptidase [Gemmatimonadaceae bacterium]